MTTEKLEKLEELLHKATPGPWWAQREYDGGRTVCSMRHQTDTVCVNKAVHADGNPWDAHLDNANLIEALRNNAESLVAAAREAIELREALEFLCSHRMSSTCGQGHVLKYSERDYMFIFHTGNRRYVEGATPLEAIQKARNGQ